MNLKSSVLISPTESLLNTQDTHSRSSFESSVLNLVFKNQPAHFRKVLDVSNKTIENFDYSMEESTTSRLKKRDIIWIIIAAILFLIIVSILLIRKF